MSAKPSVRAKFCAFVVFTTVLALAGAAHAFDTPDCGDSDSFPGAVGSHAVFATDFRFSFGGGGSLYGPNGTPGAISPEEGAIFHDSMAYALIGAGEGVIVRDAIWGEYYPPSDGFYSITMHVRTFGDAYSLAYTYIGASYTGLVARISGGIQEQSSSYSEEEIIDRKNLTSTYRLLDLGFSTANAVVDTFQSVAEAESLDQAAVDAFLDTMSIITPSVPLPDYQSHTIRGSAYLVAGEGPYHWEFLVESTIKAAALFATANYSKVYLGVCLDSIDFVLTGGSPPQVDSFFHSGLPFPVVYNGQLLLSASASDLDGTVSQVEFYRDANGNGTLDVGGDEYVGSDASPQGGQWDWVVNQVLWSPGTHRFFARAQDDEGLRSDVVPALVTIGLSPVAQGSDFTQVGEAWNDGTGQGDGDGVMEAGERVRLAIRLRSEGGATDVDALLSSSDPGVTITEPRVYFQPFASGEAKESIGAFVMELAFPLNPGETRTSDFTIQVTYELDGWEYVQDLPFSKTFYREGDVRADFEIVLPITMDDAPSYSFRNNGDGILQSGEVARMRPVVRNIGQNGATDPDIEFYFSGAGVSPVDIQGGSRRYDDIAAGGTSLPVHGELLILCFPKTSSS